MRIESKAVPQTHAPEVTSVAKQLSIEQAKLGVEADGLEKAVSLKFDTPTGALDTGAAPSPSELLTQLERFADLSAELGAERPAGPAAGFLEASFPELEGKNIASLPKNFIVQSMRAMSLVQAGDKAVDRREYRAVEGKFELARQTVLSFTANQQISVSAQQESVLQNIGPTIFKSYDTLVKTPALSGTVSAETASANIEIPSPAIVGVETVLFKNAPSLAGLDIDSLVQLVMSQCAQGSDLDLQNLINDMQKANAEKKKMRDCLASQKAQEAAMKTALQAEYNRRCGLPKGNPQRIDPAITTYETFSSTQKLLQTGVTGVDDYGVPDGDPSYSISPNTTYYPQGQDVQYDQDKLPIPQADIDEAVKLKITPQNMVALRKVWNADPSMQVRFGGSMEYWLLSSTKQGGIGLSDAPSGSQDIIVAGYRDAIGNEKPDFCNEFAISPDVYDKFSSAFDALPLAVKSAVGFSLASWITTAPPLGPGLSAAGSSGNLSDTTNDGAITTLLANLPATLSTLQGMKDYGLDEGRMHALTDFYNSNPNIAPSFDAFLKGMVGLKQPDTSPPSNNAAVDSYFVSQMSNSAAWASYNSAVANPPQPVVPPVPVLDLSQAGLGIPAGATMAEILSLIDSKTEDSGFVANLNALGDNLFPGVNGDLKAFLFAVAQLGWAKQNLGKGANLSQYANVMVQAQDKLNQDVHDATPPPAGVKLAQYIRMQLELGKAQLFACQPSRGVSNDVAPNSLLMQNFHKVVTAIVFGVPTYTDNNHIEVTVGNNKGDQWLNETGFNDAGQFLENQGIKGSADGTFPDGIQKVLDEAGTAWQIANTAQPIVPLKPTEPQPNDASNAVVDAYLTGNPPQYNSGGAYADKYDASQIISVTTANPGAPLGVPDAATQARLDALAAPVDHTLRQPDGTPVNGTEMTVDELDAHVQDLQGKMDTLGDMSESISLRLQMYNDRRSKFYETLSNLMKSVSDTRNAIVGNMKDS